MSKVLISFIGSHDLNKNPETNNAGPIVQLINYIKPIKTYLFVSSGYRKEFEEKTLEGFYKNIINNDICVIYTDIQNPTSHEEIANKISKDIEKINEEICSNKWQGFVNLTSGTPAMISVLSLFVLTGQLNKTHGVYAPNPDYDKQIKLSTLDFYKNSFTFKTLKNLINSMDYIAIEDFLLKNKKSFIKLSQREDFKNIVLFAKYLMICDYDKAKEIYEEYEYLKEFEYKTPDNLYDKAAILYMSAKISERNLDNFQTTLKAAIIRENLIDFILAELLKRLNIDLFEMKKNGNSILTYIKDGSDEKYPELFEYIDEKFKKSNTNTKTFDKKRDVNSFIQSLILEYYISISENENLNNIQKKLYGLEQLRAERNKLAHTINPPEYKDIWLKNIKILLDLVAKEFNLQKTDFEIYTKINKVLLIILKDALNN